LGILAPEKIQEIPEGREKMTGIRKGILSMVLCILVICLTWGLAKAQDPPIAPVAAPAATATSPLFEWNIALAGDIVYLATGDVGFHPGAGIDMASLKQGLVKVRLEAVWTDEMFDTPDVLAIAVGLDFIRSAEELAKMLNTDVQITEALKTLQPSGGLLTGYNFSNQDPDLKNKMVWGFWVSLIRLEF
jgi:hypothetical protein